VHFTSEMVGSILATDSCEKSQSTLCQKSWVFSGCSGFLPQGKLTGWVGINIVRKVISQLLYCKINSLTCTTRDPTAGTSAISPKYGDFVNMGGLSLTSRILIRTTLLEDNTGVP
jgi:hypothetical protein